jgi:hypothetical protein
VTVELHVVEHEHPLRVQVRLAGSAHDQRAIEPTLELHCLIHVRVIPEGTGVGELEAIRERLARPDGSLNHLRAIHRGWNPEPVPVNRRRLGETIGEPHLEHVANARSSVGPGTCPPKPHARVARPGLNSQSTSRASRSTDTSLHPGSGWAAS